MTKDAKSSDKNHTKKEVIGKKLMISIIGIVSDTQYAAQNMASSALNKLKHIHLKGNESQLNEPKKVKNIGEKIRKGCGILSMGPAALRCFDISDEILSELPYACQYMLYRLTIERSPPDSLLNLAEQLACNHLSAENFMYILKNEMEFIAEYHFFLDLLNEHHPIEKFIKLKNITPYHISGKHELVLNELIDDAHRKFDNFRLKMNEIEQSYKASKECSKAQRQFYKKLDILLTNDEAFKKFALREIYKHPLTFNDMTHFIKRFMSRPIYKKTKIISFKLYPEEREKIRTFKRF